jgi:DNA-binding Xre family transcriptional regulator
MTQPTLLEIYARNVEYQTFKRGWSRIRLATELGVSPYVLSRLHQAQGRFIDADLFHSLIQVFDCFPNDLLLPHPELEYNVNS